MRDYLSRIAERAGSQPVTVRPVLPSLFEPAKAGSAFAAPFAAREAEPIFVTEHDLQPAGEAGEKSRSIHDRVAAIQSIWTAPFTSTTPPKAETTTKQTSASHDRMPVTEPADRVFAAESHALRESSAESPRQQRTVWPRTTQPTELPQRQPTVSDAKLTSRPSVSDEPTPDTRRLAQSLATATPAAPHVIPAVSPVPRVPIESRGRARTETAFANGADASSTPTIHVTIGRVEVRAIMPAAQVTPPAPVRSAPKLSLDDYLRLRNGGAA